MAHKILMVEDDFALAMGTEYALTSEGYAVATAGNLAQAREKFDDSIDLVLLDVMLPDGTGFEFCKELREKNSDVPIIFLTAVAEEANIVQGLELGADDYVTKPFNMTILVLRIRKLIELSRYNVSKGTIDPAPSDIVITSLDEKLIEKAIKYVEDNISRSDLSVEELSRELGMSRVHLYKKMLQITGKTPIEFIRVIRLKRAAQLLRDSQLHVSEIAFQVGFNNPKYFSRYFKEEFGVLPSAYQEREDK